MPPDHQTSDRVYSRLKHDLLTGARGMGRINIAALEKRYLASATPVREALLRLVGERLVDMRAEGGFAKWQATEEEARDLYGFIERLLHLAIGWTHEPMLQHGRPEPDSLLDPPIDDLFSSIAAGSGNIMLIMTVDALNDRLHSLRGGEQVVLSGLHREFANLRDGLRGGRKDALRRSLAAYHRRRLRSLTLILRAVGR